MLRALGSASLTASIGIIAASPWALWFAPETGPWAYLFALPEYLMFVGAGWYGLAQRGTVRVRWFGAVAPTLGLIYAMVAPLIR